MVWTTCTRNVFTLVLLTTRFAGCCRGEAQHLGLLPGLFRRFMHPEMIGAFNTLEIAAVGTVHGMLVCRLQFFGIDVIVAHGASNPASGTQPPRRVFGANKLEGLSRGPDILWLLFLLPLVLSPGVIVFGLERFLLHVYGDRTPENTARSIFLPGDVIQPPAASGPFLTTSP